IAPLPPINDDPDQIRQVFINLIDNALKFTPSGGRIQVQWVTKKSPLPTDSPDAGEWLWTTVEDTGVGIPAEDLPHIFDRFYRGGKARARDSSSGSGSGAGLGLAIVKSIIDQHGGRVLAESEIGKGAAFRFALPLR
ncbi:MAG: histidine kinase, partial [Chloroflexota bacterium]|nr:histidine kinase [Chloroflexota bacterium]